MEELEAPSAVAVASEVNFRGVKLVTSGSITSTLCLVRLEIESTKLTDGNYAATLSLSENPLGGVLVLNTGKNKATYPVMLGKQDIPPSGVVAFSGQRVTIGKLHVDVKHLTQAEYRKHDDRGKSDTKNKAQTAFTTSKSQTNRSAMTDTDNNVELKPAGTIKQKNKIITVKIITAGSRIETYVLEEGGLDSVIIGSAPKSPEATFFVPDIAANHVRLNLVVQKSGPMVRVTNLQSKKSKAIAPTLLGQADIAPGTWQMAFRGASVKLGDNTTLKFV